ncbi:MAG: TolC family protein [Opitutae bacterium]|nr:TolC family protein [Opitutae bacterium]
MNKKKRISNIQYPTSNVQGGRWGLAVALVAAMLVAGAARAAEPAARELTLSECVGLALENNLELKIGKISRAVAKQEVEAAKGGYDPELSVSAKRTHEETAGEGAGTAAGALEVLGTETDNDAYEASVGGATGLGGLSYKVGARTGDSEGTRAGNPFDASTGSAGLTLTQPLLKGFKSDATRYSVALARGQSEEARVELEAKVQEVLAQVEKAWYALVRARESIRVQEDAVRLATQLYEDNRRKVQIGAMSLLDEKQAESQAASARAELSTARRAYAEAQNQLKSLVFADHRNFRGTGLAAAGELEARPVAVNLAAAGERALLDRPALRQARLALERQGITVRHQRNQTLPSLDLVGGAGVAASDEETRGDVFDRMEAADEPYWTVGVTLAFPLGNRAAKSRHAQSLATEEKLRLQLQQLEETALVEVDDAAAAVATGLERVQATEEARAYAEQALQAEQRKLASGKSTSFVVLQLQRDLTQARNAEIQALVDYNLQLSALALAQGTMLERHGVQFAVE